ncbi:Lrp/AsnC family transcriptional regulator [Bacillus sp. FJAT-42376]|uniref:Lrp/AsnC family transcriptional regulator n=1 Tax=Bacillus sp. FJAT-42376 TaxID=2014076 RepID=UPI000F4F0B9D|nr:Lrp/AsnC family transcriptional regulator [Bacillus sp. FJAT-42376]AZB41581.1 Lrp/AsnC family transcriptional regulator [Bacillus sp. FJAT-42376]
MKIDDKDRKILNELSKNSRISMRELGRSIGMSAPAVTERIKQMESYGIIKGYTLDIDYGKAGYPVSCIIEATVKNGEYNLFRRHIESLPNAAFCHRIAGNACFMLKMHAESLQQIEEFIDGISSLAQTVTHIVFSEVETGFRFTK